MQSLKARAHAHNSSGGNSASKTTAAAGDSPRHAELSRRAAPLPWYFGSEVSVEELTNSLPRLDSNFSCQLSSTPSALAFLQMSVSDVVSATKIGIEVCVKYLAPTKNLRKGIEQQAIITDMVFDNAQYFDEETQNHLETMQQALDFKMSAVAAGQATVSWSHIFQHPSCITRARSFASLTSKRLVETRQVSANAKREYQRQHKITVSSESLSINLENVELSRGTKSIELPFPLQKDYVVSATFRLRPADDANGASVASLDSAQSVTLNGTVDLIEHALSEGSDGGLPDLEVAFREMSCTVAE